MRPSKREIAGIVVGLALTTGGAFTLGMSVGQGRNVDEVRPVHVDPFLQSAICVEGKSLTDIELAVTAGSQFGPGTTDEIIELADMIAYAVTQCP